ncbi:hypothetical protein SCLCIDRAFT_10833 [Scleroderma citrinum Foug A]|uniref:Uncharacterized protein n=1 Tax=Scleroderma citrinum Foug A TaxID=1036808 RepID=A0A0C2ZU09_9AGAM|nr:hypothetical protein SCLCIDRAFT_10833 [Scleroderma citrinum Foug A]
MCVTTSLTIVSIPVRSKPIRRGQHRVQVTQDQCYEIIIGGAHASDEIVPLPVMKINNQANPKPKGLGDEGQRAAFVKGERGEFQRQKWRMCEDVSQGPSIPTVKKESIAITTTKIRTRFATTIERAGTVIAIGAGTSDGHSRDNCHESREQDEVPPYGNEGEENDRRRDNEVEMTDRTYQGD